MKSSHRLVQSQRKTEQVGKLKIAPTEIKVGSMRERVFVTYVEDCEEFYIQLYDSVVSVIADALEEVYQSRGRPGGLQSFPVGGYCAAQYVDKNWYRAEIRKVEEEDGETKVHVFYTDFGNYDTVSPSKIKRLLDNLYKEKAQAIRCSLKDVYPRAEGEWKEVISLFKEVTTEEDGVEFYVDVKKKEAESYSVVLYKQKNGDVMNAFSVNSYLVKQHLALSRRALLDPSPIQLPNSTFWDVHVTSVSSCTHINMRLVGPDYSEELEKLELTLGETYAPVMSLRKVNVEDLEAGQVYAACDDDVWYRVKVQNIQGDEVEVLYVDYGECDMVNVAQLCRMRPQHNVLPYQAISCTLYGLESLADNEKVAQKLYDLAQDKTLIAEIIDREDGDRISVVLYDTAGEEDLNINEAVVQDEDLLPVLPDLETNADMYISHVTDDGHVFVQIPGSGLSRLDTLMQDINEYYQDRRASAEEFVSSAEPGRLCCARFGEEECWGRAELIKLLPDRKVEVKLVDFGHIEVLPLNGLREFTKSNLHLQSLPFQAVECVLTGLPPSNARWSDLGLQRLRELVSRDQLYTVSVNTEATEHAPPSISIYTEEEGGLLTWLNEKMLEEQDFFIWNWEDTAADVSMDSVVTMSSISGVVPAEGEAVLSIHGDDSSLQDSVFADMSAAAAGDSVDITGISDDELTTLPPPTLVETPSEGEYFDVSVSHVVDPTNFMVVPYESTDDRTRLIAEMFEFYSMRIVQMGEVYEGDVVAVLNDDGFWYRAEVKAVLGEGEVVNVYFLDYGDFNIVEYSVIQPLVNKFRILPWQALRAKLAGVSPVSPTSRGWSLDCKSRFEELVLEKDLVGLVCKHRDCLSLLLIDTSSEAEDVVIGDILVEEGFAVKEEIS